MNPLNHDNVGYDLYVIVGFLVVCSKCPRARTNMLERLTTYELVLEYPDGREFCWFQVLGCGV